MKKSISIMDYLLTIIGMINTILGLFTTTSINIIIGLIILILGIGVLIYVVFSFFKELKISNFITNNEKYYKSKSPFVNSIDEKKDWMFLEISKKFPQMTCISIRKKIDKHYELIERDFSKHNIISQ